MGKEINFPCAISINDLSRLKEYFAAGLGGIAICNHGIARSWKYAEYATSCLGIPSVFLEGGLSELSKLSEGKQKRTVSRIDAIPEKYAILTSDEIAQYADLLNRLHVCLVDGSKY